MSYETFLFEKMFPSNSCLTMSCASTSFKMSPIEADCWLMGQIRSTRDALILALVQMLQYPGGPLHMGIKNVCICHIFSALCLRPLKESSGADFFAAYRNRKYSSEKMPQGSFLSAHALAISFTRCTMTHMDGLFSIQ